MVRHRIQTEAMNTQTSQQTDQSYAKLHWLRPCSHCIRFAYWILVNRSCRLSVVGFCSHYQLLTRRERYAYLSPCTHCVCFATLLVTLWHILRFPGHVLIVSHVALVLTKETSGNILLVCQLVSVLLLPHSVRIATRAIRSITN